MLDLEKTKDQVKEAANIVEVIGEFVTLRKAGVNYKGICPFHNDHTPSMMVSPVRQTFKCFVCGEGGDVIHFLMKHENLTFIEAIEWLCKKYHIEMPKREMTDEEQEEYKQREATQRGSLFPCSARLRRSDHTGTCGLRCRLCPCGQCRRR